MAENVEQLNGRKVVFVISPQWFQPEGALEAQFAPNYSTLHGYDFAFNEEIDQSIKKRALKRLLEFSTINGDPILRTLYEGELYDDPWKKRKASLVKPIAKLYVKVLEKKDLYYSVFESEERERKIVKKVKNKSFSDLEKMAVRIGKANSNSNNFRIVDPQYDKIKNRVHDLKDSKIGASYGVSKEYDDIQLVIDLLRESKAEALFISVPVNGLWYDYVGFPKKGRTDYYKKIKQQVDNSGYQIADFSEHEYDPYFMKDAIHIGWKGWVHTNKAIEEFYYEKR
jgi:D-alanine transfer protein